MLIGYIQFETPSSQMNNKRYNMWSENTFTFDHRKNGVTNQIMEDLYHTIVNRIEQLKYGNPSAEVHVAVKPKEKKISSPGGKIVYSDTVSSSVSANDTKNPKSIDEIERLYQQGGMSEEEYRTALLKDALRQTSKASNPYLK